jgi:histidinol-phosphate aminotransferase
LRSAIAECHGLPVEQVFLGNGSDEVLAHAFFAFFQQGCPLLMPDISYSFYKVYCGLYSIDVRTVPLTNAMQVDIGDYVVSGGQPVWPVW